MSVLLVRTVSAERPTCEGDANELASEMDRLVGVPDSSRRRGRAVEDGMDGVDTPSEKRAGESDRGEPRSKGEAATDEVKLRLVESVKVNL